MKYFLILFLVTKLNYAILCVNQNRAKSGKLCRKWNTIRSEWGKSEVKEITGYTEHNQCVQVSGYSYPACFTSSTKLERCHCHETSPNCKDISTTMAPNRDKTEIL